MAAPFTKRAGLRVRRRVAGRGSVLAEPDGLRRLATRRLLVENKSQHGRVILFEQRTTSTRVLCKNLDHSQTAAAEGTGCGWCSELMSRNQVLRPATGAANRAAGWCIRTRPAGKRRHGVHVGWWRHGRGSHRLSRPPGALSLHSSVGSFRVRGLEVNGKSPIRIAVFATTTGRSISVNAER